MKNFKSGFVTIIGRPNVGKSTLLNKVLGEKIAIMSDKPQTTRNTIQCIVTSDRHQIIFIDTPGIHKPKHKLGEFMVKSASDTFSEVDIVLFVVEPNTAVGQGDKYIAEMIGNTKTPVILVINKIDQIKKEEILRVIDAFKNLYNFISIVPISAITGDGVELLINEIEKMLPEGPKYFPDDMITDQPEKQIVSEMIREKVLHLISEEIPHGVAVEITSMKERENNQIIDIQATIICEKDSHKGIIIGKNGAMLKKIGQFAREDVERFLGMKVFLELWVKVKNDWRNSDNMLKTLGYK